MKRAPMIVANNDQLRDVCECLQGLASSIKGAGEDIRLGLGEHGAANGVSEFVIVQLTETIGEGFEQIRAAIAPTRAKP